MAGDLTLTAQQVYPSTLSQFVISADPNSVTAPTAGSISISGSAGSSTDLLSAGGALTLSAGTVNQNGVLRAPLGSLSIDAQAITLGPGSITSTSAQGLAIPFGTTQGGIDWVYPLPNGPTTTFDVVYGTGGLTPPAQRIALQGAEVNLQKGAVVDVSGGGDLLAYEWILGPGGTNDVLSNSASNGGRPAQFAILPALNLNVTPYDPNISAGTTLSPGDAVYLSGMPGLPAGVYQLLPARYALLGGAYLVTPVSGYQDIQPGQSFPVLGGGTIISGYQTVAGTSFADSRTSGFEVVPGSVVLTQAEYTTTSGNQFFSSQAAAAVGAAGSATATAAPPRLPQDSGIVALIASDTLTLNGTLQTGAGPNGLGAEVDIASANILIAPAGTPTQPGQILVPSSSLGALAAQTLLIGGLRTGDDIATTAQSIEVASGASVSAPEIFLSAQDSVTVDDGAQLSAMGSAPGGRTLGLSGDGAFLAMSAGVQNTVVRTGATGGAGLLTLAPGSSLDAHNGSMFLEASNNVSTGGTLSLDGANFAVQSPNISLGAAPAGTPGTVIGSAVFGQNLGTLLLQSTLPIDLYGSLTVNAQNITLDTPQLAGFGAANDTVQLTAAKNFTLLDSSATAGGSQGNGTGTLKISATDITFGGGSIEASGLSMIALDATDTVTAVASGALSTIGNLNATASQITVGSNVQLTLQATGAVAFLASSQPTAASAATLGGSLSIIGTSIDIGTNITLPSGGLTLTATGGNLSVDAGANLSVAGVVQQYDGVAVATPGGILSLSSTGNIEIAGGSTLDVGGGAGQGGCLSILATQGTVGVAGTLMGTGAAGSGSTFAVDAQNFGDFSALNQVLNAGGFTGARTFRLRGPGDLIVAAGAANAVTASTVMLEADQGGISVNGLIDASGAQGGSVTLAAASDINVNGTIDARATSSGGRGGTVQLDTEGGQMLLNAGSIIDVSGGGTGQGVGAGGSVLLRVPAATVEAVASGGSGVLLAGTIQGSSKTSLEAFTATQNTSGVISNADVLADPSNPLYAAAQNTMSNASAIVQALGQAGNANFLLEPGVEIDATIASNGTGTLTLAAPWDLSTWRFGENGTVPGVLTLRAQGGITFNASLSDGFTGTSGPAAFTLPAQPSDSWSYRIAAGADFAAANPLTVDARTPADVTISACGGGSTCQPYPTVGRRGVTPVYTPTMVRTGDGFIDIAASGNFVLGDQGSLLYTAGVANPAGIPIPGRPGTLQGRAYPTDGGDIQVDVGGNVQGAPTNQFVNAWLWRVGSSPLNPSGSASAWTVDYQSFQQGIAALGGGNITIRAGGDISDLSASIPSVGVQVGSTTNSQNIVKVTGGGILDVAAGGSILGGSFYDGLGALALLAGNSVGLGSLGLAPIIGLGDTSAVITARGDARLSDILNPSLLNQGFLQGTGNTQVAYYSTYGATSSVTLTSIGGDAVLADDSGTVSTVLAPSFRGRTFSGALDTMPPILDVYAFGGDIDVARTISLLPSASANLNFFADQNILAGTIGGGAAQLVISDVDPAQLPSPDAPTLSVQLFYDIAGAVTAALPNQHAPTPVFAASDQAGTLAPARLVAQNGSIAFQTSQGAVSSQGIWSAKPVHISAGLDVADLNLVAQNVSNADVTSVTAGRDIIYPLPRQADGSVLPDSDGIVVDGPGQLQLTAGRNIDLGTSNGVSSRANLLNPVLPAGGASISVQAGIIGGTPQYASFINTYIDGSSAFDAELIAFMESVNGMSGLTAEQAHEQFATLTSQLQRTFVEQAFFDLVRTSGRDAAAKGNGDFSGAFAAIESLFPGANPNLAEGQTNPYAGDIALYFSRIYTEQGGNISLFAPGGQINVGLALAPSSFGITKLPDQLGIVAQTTGSVDAFGYSDFQVNASRVFAADGGDILIWTTEGNIDAGRGAKTAISAPELNIVYDANAQPAVTLRAAIAGSGIQALTATPGILPGDVDLFAPHGVVNANDAGIVAGNLTIAATAVLGANNITVSGTSVGVPVTVTGLGAAVSGASSAAGATANVAESIGGGNSTAGSTPVADQALNFIEVFVTGLGEENCKADDLECLKKAAGHPASQ
jgi:hypothetical protein